MPNLLDLVFPPKCVFCENFGSLVCNDCLASFRKVSKFHVYPLVYPLDSKKSYEKSTSFDFVPSLEIKVFSYFSYENQIRECIKYSKYSKKQFAILREITKYAVTHMLLEKIAFFNSDLGQSDLKPVVVPIPLSKAKQKYRGFNQAEVIASVFAKGYSLSMQNSILTRQRDTEAQHRLNKGERLKNISGAFAVSPRVAQQSFILVDDICTTGATLIEVANTFYAFGAKEVTAFTLSKRL